MNFSLKLTFFAGLIFCVSCSFKISDSKKGGLTIKLEEKESLGFNFFEKLSAVSQKEFFPFAGPAAISNFGCFAVNISGVGVPEDSDELKNCFLTGYQNVVPLHNVSELFTRNESVFFDIPSGKNRRIDVYGIYPLNGDCERNQAIPASEYDGGYILGTKTVDVEETTSVVIPISLANPLPAVRCIDDDENGMPEIYYSYPTGGTDSTSFPITFYGKNFEEGAVVSFSKSSNTCTSVVVNQNGTELTCNSPSSGNVGNVPGIVTIRNLSQKAASSDFIFVNGSGYISPRYGFNAFFGNIAVSSSSDYTVEIKNFGPSISVNLDTNSSITGSSEINYKGGSFPGTGGTCAPSLPSGSSCTIVFTFSPTSTGLKEATYSTSGSNTVSIDLTGVGI